MYKEQVSGQRDYKHLTWQDPDRHRGQVLSLPSREMQREKQRERWRQGWRVGDGEGVCFISFQNYRINKPLKLKEGRLLNKAEE